MNQAMETPFRAIRQIGLVTGDLDRFIQNMENLYHLRPDRTAFVPVGATKETCLRRLAFYEFEHVELEVVEPLRSHPAWHIFLDRHGDCLQHIKKPTQIKQIKKKHSIFFIIIHQPLVRKKKIKQFFQHML